MDYETKNSTITIKTIDKQIINLTGDFHTISNLMDKLQIEHQFPKENQQLIYSGKVLKESDKIPEMGKNSFIVLLMKKTKLNKLVEETKHSTDIVTKTNDIANETNQSNNKSDDTITSETTTIELDNSSNDIQDDTITTELDNNSSNDIPNDIINQEPNNIETETIENNTIPSNPLQDIIPNQEMVENLMTMGFDIDNINKALKITKNNLEMAGALLMESGMIEKIENNPELVSNNQPTTQSSNLTEEQVITLMEQHPQEFQQLIGKIVEQQPEIANLVQNDPTSFITLFTKILNETGILNRNPTQSNLQQQTSSQQQIDMTAEEKELLTGLQQMFPNIPNITILETLRACDNNEEMTANLLFEYD